MSLTDPVQQKRIYARLMPAFERSAGQNCEPRWRWLTAAHIAGQSHFRLHLHNHTAMLGYAARTRDWKEGVGQLFRIALVPRGHTFGRLPPGNIGRSTVSPFQPMAVDAGTRAAISRARRRALDEAAGSPQP
jgi:hypothetical protein